MMTAMNNRKNFLIVLISLFFCLTGLHSSKAQSAQDLRINEFLVYNDSNYVDDFGQHGPWIEIFNSAYNTVNIGGLYLTDDLSNPRKYQIPKGQNMTQIPPRSYLVFWADNMGDRGILHLNFDLRNSKVIALFDANGKSLIDSVSIPQNSHLKRDSTFGRVEDGLVEWKYLEKSTPNAANSTAEKVTGAMLFDNLDPYGGGMAMVAMFVVFTGLAILFIFFKNMSRIINWERKKPQTTEPVVVTAPTEGISGEVNAAIALVLHLYVNELHDHENTVLTINKVSRTYSPWSSKIYGLRRTPRQ
jgi:Na+-transporting methylmalonyl-CoA/oxaloacetate decarboxylase gamma subunit